MGRIDTTGLFGLEMLRALRRSQTKAPLTAGGKGIFSERRGRKKVTKGVLNGREARTHPPERPGIRQTGSPLRALYTSTPSLG